MPSRVEEGEELLLIPSCVCYLEGVGGNLHVAYLPSWSTDEG